MEGSAAVQAESALDGKAEWEEQVGSLELKQLKLMRAQISTTLREIAEMRDDFISLARKQASLERGLADVDAKHSQKSVDIRTWEHKTSGRTADDTTDYDCQPLSPRALSDRCDGLTALLGKAGDAREADMRCINEALARHEKDIESMKASRGEAAKVTSLEERLRDVADAFARERDEVRRTLAANEEAIQRISSDVMRTTGSVGRLVREVISARKACEVGGGRVRSDDEEQLQLQVQKRDSSHSEETVDLTAMNDMLVSHEAALRAIRLELALLHDVSRPASTAGDAEPSEKHLRSVQALQDAMSRLAAASGTYDPEFREFRSLFTVHAKFGDRLGRLEEILSDPAFLKLLPDRLRVLEKRVADLSLSPKPTAAAAAPRAIGRDASPAQSRMSQLGSAAKLHSVRSPGASPPPSGRKGSPLRPSELECWKVLHATVAQYVQLINDRRNIVYDTKTRRAFLQLPLSFKRRVFSAGQADEPTAEWADDAQRPVLEDICLLYRSFVGVAVQRFPDSQVRAVVIRTRARKAAHPGSVSMRATSPALSHSGPGSASFAVGGSYRDRMNQWETQLATSRVQLLADSVAATGVPKYCIETRVDVGPKDDYLVEFQMRLPFLDHARSALALDGR